MSSMPVWFVVFVMGICGIVIGIICKYHQMCNKKKGCVEDDKKRNGT